MIDRFWRNSEEFPNPDCIIITFSLRKLPDSRLTKMLTPIQSVELILFDFWDILDHVLYRFDHKSPKLCTNDWQLFHINQSCVVGKHSVRSSIQLIWESRSKSPKFNGKHTLGESASSLTFPTSHPSCLTGIILLHRRFANCNLPPISFRPIECV